MSSNAGLDAVIVESQIVNQEFLDAVDSIIKRTIENGSLLLSGSGGSGKTFASFWITRRIMQDAKFESNEYKITIIDPILNHRFKFDAMPYIEYANTNVIPKKRAIIIDMNNMSPKAKKDGLSNILNSDFTLKQKLKIENKGVNIYKNFYILDELHNILGRYALVGSNGAELLDIITECRNVDMYLIGITRRLADLSTQFTESCRTNLIGKTSGQNDLIKIEKMYGSKVSKAVANLKQRSFIYHDSETGEISEIGFPDFKAIGSPYEVKENTSQGYVKIW